MPTLVNQFGSPLSSVALTDNIYVDTGSADGRAALQSVYNAFNLDFFGFDPCLIIKNPLNGLCFKTDFLENNTTQMLVNPNGAGASGAKGSYGADQTKKAIGILRITPGTTSTGRTEVFLDSSEAFPLALGKALSIHRIAVEALSTSGDEYRAYCGWRGNYTVKFAGYWLYDRAVNGDYWTCITGFSPVTKTVTSIPVTTDYIWLATVTNSNWSQVDFYYSSNGVTWTLAATHTTNIPTSGNSQVISGGITKIAGTANVYMDIDYFMFAYMFNR